MSCAVGRVPKEGFTSHAPKSAVSIEAKGLQCNAQSLLNVALQGALFHLSREKHALVAFLRALSGANVQAQAASSR